MFRMSDDSLQQYRRKRDFASTSEPQGGRPSAGGNLSFVVQKHAARNLHYDFRLELDGVLKSWAVPKGPSLDPQDKRMAVHVEDHPMDYAGFEGVIPPGQYGAGTVIVWDRGEWRPVGDPRAGYRAGKLKFELLGSKLAGHWTLVRMRGRGDERQEPWLLIKERDEAARPASEFDVVEALPDSVLGAAAAAKTTKGAGGDKGRESPPAKKSRAEPGPKAKRRTALPLTLSPQLATLVDAVPADASEWIYELKFDGYRLLARIEDGSVRLFTRNGNDWTAKLKPLAGTLAGLGLPPCWIDGEIVVADKRGIPDFQSLQNAFDTARTGRIQYHVFDLPFFDGHDLRQQPLRARRDLLRQALVQVGAPPERVRFSEDFPVAAASLLHTACELRMEGLIGKRADSVYEGRRSPNWIKLKCTQRQEFVIGGYTDPKGSRTGFGALMLGVHDEAGRLRYAGNVGTGFDTKHLASLTDKLVALHTPSAPFDPLPAGVKGHWVKPRLVAEVSFGGWTKEGRIRHASFHGLRSDKPASAIGVERPAPAAAARRDKGAKARSGGTPKRAGKPPALPAGLKVTHPDRVIDPSTGITKLELVQYLVRAGRHLLPHLKARPVALVRAPDGVGGELIFQKHGDKLRIPGLKQLDPSLDPGHAPLLELPTVPALAGAAQMNCIEFHTWNATTRHIERPDRMTFDLDPGEGFAWSRMQEAARLVHVMLDELGLRSFLKTSGGKGLHVVVPLKPALGWDTVKSFSQAVVQHLAATIPQVFVAKSGPRNRVGKLFVDYLRNGRGATTVVAWSARARPGMGVSVPVRWDELDGLSGGAHWNIRNVDDRLAAGDAWEGYGAASRQTLTAAMKALDFIPPKSGRARGGSK
jgi:bifunctional non-homologous end joining protein LigD